MDKSIGRADVDIVWPPAVQRPYTPVEKRHVDLGRLGIQLGATAWVLMVFGALFERVAVNIPFAKIASGCGILLHGAGLGAALLAFGLGIRMRTSVNGRIALAISAIPVATVACVILMLLVDFLNVHG